MKIPTVVDPRSLPPCDVCGDDIDGNMMIPENSSPIHASCFGEWLNEYGATA